MIDLKRVEKKTHCPINHEQNIFFIHACLSEIDFKFQNRGLNRWRFRKENFITDVLFPNKKVHTSAYQKQNASVEPDLRFVYLKN